MINQKENNKIPEAENNPQNFQNLKEKNINEQKDFNNDNTNKEDFEINNENKINEKENRNIDNNNNNDKIRSEILFEDVNKEFQKEIFEEKNDQSELIKLDLK